MKIKNLTYLLFVLSNLLILFNPGIFWDDWTLYTIPPEMIILNFNSGGIGYFGYIHVFLQKFFNPPILYHTLTFCLQLISVYFLFKIGDKLTVYKQGSSGLKYLVLIYAILPVNDAKITMICFPYTLTLTIFILATYFLIKYRYEKNPLIRILSLTLYFISFTTVSLVFFFLVPLILIIFYEEVNLILYNQTISFKKLFRAIGLKIIRYLDFILLPIIFWIIKTNFFSASNHYVGYNEINIESLFEIPLRLLRFINVSIISLIPLLTDFILNFEFILMFILLSVFIFLRLGNLEVRFKPTMTKVLIGLIVCFIGVFPYLLVGKYPSFNGYYSRHQLLIGFGVSILILNLIFYISSTKFRKVTLATILSFMVILNISIHFEYFKGYMKQVVLNNFLETQNLSAQRSQTIFYKDNTSNFTNKGNPSHFYELSGILKLSHPAERIMLIREKDFIAHNEYNDFQKFEPYFLSYNISNYKLGEPNLELEINYSEKSLPLFKFLTFYGNYLNGNKDQWIEYFDFNLKPIKRDFENGKF